MCEIIGIQELIPLGLSDRHWSVSWEMITEVANVILQVRPDVMLTNMPKQSELPTAVKHWTLTTLLVKLIKTGAKVVHHARYATFQLAEVAIPRNVFAAILARIRHWATKARTGPPAVPTCHAQGHPI